MDTSLFPTKGNLMLCKNTLKLSKQGFELLDKKRNNLIHEMMEQIEKAKLLQEKIDSTFMSAYKALETANIMMGALTVEHISMSVPVDNAFDLKFKSIMGVEIPFIKNSGQGTLKPGYGITRTHPSLDEAYVRFDDVKKLVCELAEVENTVYRLAYNIRKTQKRANALENIIIPKYENTIKVISSALEEKEREEFTRLKVIKKIK